MFTTNHDLDVSAPDQVPNVLRQAAQAYRESSGELASAWQDTGAGAVWNDLARVLERAADSADKALAKRGF
jgi:hypothetical protein